MKRYFGLLLMSVGCINAMDNNNNNQTPNQLMTQEDKRNEEKVKEMLQEMLTLSVVHGKYKPQKLSHQKQQPPMTKVTQQTFQPSQTLPPTTTQSSEVSSPGLSRLSQTLKSTTISSPTTDRKLQAPPSQLINNDPFPVITLPPSLSTNINNNNCNRDDISEYSRQIDSESKTTDDDYQSEEENEFTKKIRAKNWEDSTMIKRTFGPFSDKEYQNAVNEQLIGLKVLHDQYVIGSPKEEKKGSDILNALKTSQPRSNNNNDDNNNNNNNKK